MPAYFSKKFESRPSAIAGHGSFATEPIAQGEIVIDFSTAPQIIISKKEADSRYSRGFDYMLQIGDDAFLVTVPDKLHENLGYVNHSCSPNCGINYQMQFVAMRDIPEREEITFDYAMSESTPFSFACHCLSPQCRGTITGEDWKIPQLQQKYDGFFSDYLRLKIKNL